MPCCTIASKSALQHEPSTNDVRIAVIAVFGMLIYHLKRTGRPAMNMQRRKPNSANANAPVITDWRMKQRSIRTVAGKLPKTVAKTEIMRKSM